MKERKLIKAWYTCWQRSFPHSPQEAGPGVEDVQLQDLRNHLLSLDGERLLIHDVRVT